MTQSSNTPAFQQVQYAFAAHLRDPEHNPPPSGIEDRRLQIYRELFYNNVEGFLSSGFPVLRSLIKDAEWHAMARDFFSRHRCHTPYFLEISQEFLHYLQHEREPQTADLPFMLELAHYEWLELAVDVDTDTIPTCGFNPEGNLLHGRPLLSPLAHVACYAFPVHRICVDFQPQTAPEQPTFLIIYRNPADQVRFMEINAVTARLLVLLQEQPDATGQDVLNQIAGELPHLPRETVIQGGAQALQHLRDVGIALGTELKPV